MEIRPEWLGTGFVLFARYAVPTIIVTAITPSMVRVFDAFLPCGLRNALTPLEMASVPVSAAAPEENECRITNRLATPAVPIGIGSGGAAAWGHEPRHFTTPTAISTNIEAMKPYVGMAKSTPDSRTPRRFASIRSATQPTAIGTR